MLHWMQAMSSGTLRAGRETLLLLGLPLLGCSGPVAASSARLPFRVAVIPVEVVTIPQAMRVEEDDPLTITLHADALSEDLVRSLREECFTETELLAYPAAVSRQEFFNSPGADQMDYWSRAAAAAKADLVLQPVVRYREDVEHEMKGFMVFLNLLTFTLGGPFCWWIDDHSYRPEAYLSVRLYDLSRAIQTDKAITSSDQLVAFESRSPELEFDFVDRVGDGWGSYLLSCLVPSTLLRGESEGVREQIQVTLGQEFGSEVVGRLWDREQEIIVPDRLVSFFPDPKTLEARRISLDAIRVTGELLLRRDAGVDSLDSFALLPSGMTDWQEELFDGGVLDDALTTRADRYFRYSLDTTVAVLPGATSVQLRVTQGGRNNLERTFTLPVSPAGEEGQALAWERRRR